MTHCHVVILHIRKIADSSQAERARDESVELFDEEDTTIYDYTLDINQQENRDGQTYFFDVCLPRNHSYGLVLENDDGDLDWCLFSGVIENLLIYSGDT